MKSPEVSVSMNLSDDDDDDDDSEEEEEKLDHVQQFNGDLKATSNADADDDTEDSSRPIPLKRFVQTGGRLKIAHQTSLQLARALTYFDANEHDIRTVEIVWDPMTQPQHQNAQFEIATRLGAFLQDWPNLRQITFRVLKRSEFLSGNNPWSSRQLDQLVQSLIRNTKADIMQVEFRGCVAPTPKVLTQLIQSKYKSLKILRFSADEDEVWKSPINVDYEYYYLDAEDSSTKAASSSLAIWSPKPVALTALQAISELASKIQEIRIFLANVLEAMECVDTLADFLQVHRPSHQTRQVGEQQQQQEKPQRPQRIASFSSAFTRAPKKMKPQRHSSLSSALGLAKKKKKSDTSKDTTTKCGTNIRDSATHIANTTTTTATATAATTIDSIVLKRSVLVDVSMRTINVDVSPILLALADSRRRLIANLKQIVLEGLSWMRPSLENLHRLAELKGKTTHQSLFRLNTFQMHSCILEEFGLEDLSFLELFGSSLRVLSLKHCDTSSSNSTSTTLGESLVAKKRPVIAATYLCNHISTSTWLRQLDLARIRMSTSDLIPKLSSALQSPSSVLEELTITLLKPSHKTRRDSTQSATTTLATTPTQQEQEYNNLFLNFIQQGIGGAKRLTNLNFYMTPMEEPSIAQALIDVLKRNDRLQTVHVTLDFSNLFKHDKIHQSYLEQEIYGSQIKFYTSLNCHGRSLIRCITQNTATQRADENSYYNTAVVPLGLWPEILARQSHNPSALYYFCVRILPDLVQ